MSALESALESLIHAPFAAATGWALLHSLWQGAVLAGAFAALLLVVRGPRVRYVAACAALLLMLAAFCVTLFLMLPKGLGSARTFNSTSPAALAWPVQPAGGPADSFAAGLAALVPWLSLVWVAGVCFVYALRLAGGISLGRLRRRGVCSAPERWQHELARLRTRLRVSRPVVLLESCLADTPMVLGHFRPLILMPVGVLAGLSPAQVEAVLLHELAHVRRCDYLVNLLQRLVEGLFFYHPAIWWISGRARDERENCCDDAVVSISHDSQDYAAALAALEENRTLARGAAVAATGGTLVKRIRRLLYPQAPSSAWAPFLAAVLFLATATVAMAALWQAAPSHQATTTTETQVQATASVSADLQKQLVATEQLLSAADQELELLRSQASQLQELQDTLPAQAVPSQDATATTETQTRAAVTASAGLQSQLIATEQLLSAAEAELDQLRSQVNQWKDTPAAELRQIQALQQQIEKMNDNAELKDTQAVQAQRAALVAQLSATQKQLEDLRTLYTPDNIRVRAAEARTDALRRQIQQMGDNPEFKDAPAAQAGSGSQTSFPEVVSKERADAEARAEAALSPKYRDWLTTQVVYIVTPTERDAFLRLKTDSERDDFITQFWAKRNPTPGAATNPFKEEYYRRIEYSNKHFAAPSAPGWRTDRGRTYIVYGPPDEVDPSSKSNPPTETWRYRHVEGQGGNGTMTVTFADRSDNGDYRIYTPMPRIVKKDTAEPPAPPSTSPHASADRAPIVVAPLSSPTIIAPKVLPTISAPKATPAAPASAPKQAPVHDTQSARNEPIIVGSDPLVPLLMTGPYFPAGAQLHK